MVHVQNQQLVQRGQINFEDVVKERLIWALPHVSHLLLPFHHHARSPRPSPARRRFRSRIKPVVGDTCAPLPCPCSLCFPKAGARRSFDGRRLPGSRTQNTSTPFNLGCRTTHPWSGPGSFRSVRSTVTYKRCKRESNPVNIPRRLLAWAFLTSTRMRHLARFS